MVDRVQTFAGSMLSISATLPTVEGVGTGGYTGASYTELAEITDIPEFGKEYTVVPHNPVKNRKTRKFKGSYDNGSLTVLMARVDTDEGQALALAALDSDNDYAFKLEYQDGSIDYFSAQVTSFKSVSGDVNKIVDRSMNIEITSEIYSIEAP